MSLEHTLLNRLEARSIQLAQMKKEIHGLRLLVDEKMTINESLAAEVIKERETARANYEHMERQIAGLRGECEQLRREVPLESTREALKNAVAKLQEVNAQLDSAKGEAEEWLKQCHAARRQRDEVKAEARKETQRLSDLCAELQGKHESLLAKTTDLGSYAMTLGRKEGEPLEMFMERQALRLAALESKAGPSIEALSAELSVRYAEIAELHKWATGLIESPAFAHYHYERVQEYNAIVARINSRPQLDLTATLPAIDWQAICTKREDEIARLNAKVGPLEKLYTTIKKHLDHGIFFSSGAGIYDAVAETAKELSQLTA